MPGTRYIELMVYSWYKEIWTAAACNWFLRERSVHGMKECTKMATLLLFKPRAGEVKREILRK